MCELSGAEEAGDPERLFGAFQGLIVRWQVGLGEGQLQVTRAVGQVGVLLALEEENAPSVSSGLSCEDITDSWSC